MESLPTLDEFIASKLHSRISSNGYVTEPGFSILYIRVTTRWLERKMRPTIDLAVITAEKPGKGAFTQLIYKLKKTYPNMSLYVESVLNCRFQKTLVEKLGFVPDPNSPQCFYMLRERRKEEE